MQDVAAGGFRGDVRAVEVAGRELGRAQVLDLGEAEFVEVGGDLLGLGEAQPRFAELGDPGGAGLQGGTPLGRHPRDRLKQAVREDGRDAITHYRVRERFRTMTLVECRLETGRTHQIRVHMAHVKHPLVGDPQYGGLLKLPKGAGAPLVDALRGFKRQALHAEQLEFVHPKTGKPASFEAAPPADMQGVLAALREDVREHAG